MSDNPSLTKPAKLLLLAALLAKDRIISNNSKSFLKEVILRRDPELIAILQSFESKTSKDNSFLEKMHDIIKREAEVTYNDIFMDTPIEIGKALSKRERDIKQLQSEKSLIYGEVEFRSFYDILRTINPDPGLVFYDLGSGTGKAVFVARLTQDFSRCIGIEILDGLHSQATKVVTRYNDSYKSSLFNTTAKVLTKKAGDDGNEEEEDCQSVEVYHGSFLDYDWSDGDVVFANSTCFEDDLMTKMTKQAENLKPGSIVVTFTKGMNSKAFELIDKRRHKMSWGPATVFIHRRLRLDGKPIGPVRLNRLPGDKDYNGDDDDNDDDNDNDNNRSNNGIGYGNTINMGVNSQNDDFDDELEDGEMGEDEYDDANDGNGMEIDVDDNEDDDEDDQEDGEGEDQDGDDSSASSSINQLPPPPPGDYSAGSSSPAMSSKDPYGMDIMGSPQDSALLRRKRLIHDTKPPLPPGSTSPAPKIRDSSGMDIMGSPQDTALMRRKRAARETSGSNPPPPPGSSSPLPPTKDIYGMDIMGSPQDTALMRRKRAGKP